MTTWYVACLDREDDRFGVWFPQFPGCVSVGHNFSEAMANGEEVLAGHVHFMRVDDDPVPEAKRVEDLMRDDELKKEMEGQFIVLIPLHETAPSAIAAE